MLVNFIFLFFSFVFESYQYCFSSSSFCKCKFFRQSLGNISCADYREYRYIWYLSNSSLTQSDLTLSLVCSVTKCSINKLICRSTCRFRFAKRWLLKRKERREKKANTLWSFFFSATHYLSRRLFPCYVFDRFVGWLSLYMCELLWGCSTMYDW